MAAMTPEEFAAAMMRWRLEIERQTAAEFDRREQQIRELLEKWVSGLTPAVAMSLNGEILGLCDADTPVGARPYIFRGQRATAAAQDARKAREASPMPPAAFRPRLPRRWAPLAKP